MRIHGVAVNHNTSAYMELMLRSLFARNPGIPLKVTVYDNGSKDDMGALIDYARIAGVPILPSGFTTDTTNNSHGDVLRRFVLDPARSACDYLLFLDADVSFEQPDVVRHLLDALESDATAFGAGPRMSWDGMTELPSEVVANPSLYVNRLHPCCALVRHTALVRLVVAEVGFSAISYHWAERTEYWDTFELFTRVMRTHGLRHVIVDALVMHAFAVSYPDESSPLLARKNRLRDERLAFFRAESPGITQ